MNPLIDSILRDMDFKCYNYHEDRHGKTAQYVHDQTGDIVSIVHSVVDNEEDHNSIEEHLEQGEYTFDFEGNPRLILNGHGNDKSGNIYKKYAVYANDENGRDVFSAMYDTEEDARGLFEEQKQYTTYGHIELVHVRLLGEEHITEVSPYYSESVGDYRFLLRETIESWYKEDEWKEGLDEYDLEHLAEGCISSLDTFKDNRKLHHAYNKRNPGEQDHCVGCKAIAIKLGLEEDDKKEE
jgi:hypothetical protein|tara:strand:+ start:1864 stop:2580 length:717 start_codon:yes stop_codon:yes gene_type:complete